MNLKTNDMKINNGDVFNIGQTINGVYKFLWLNNNWYYFEDRLTLEYQYDKDELTTLVNENEFDEVSYLGNILTQFNQY
jgi:hypothetical protein